MQFEERRQRAIAILVDKGIPIARAEPTPLRAARALGIRLRPLHFETFGRLTLFYGIGFALIWGVIRVLITLPAGGMSLADALAVPAFGGLVFGPIMAAVLRRRARKLGLPSWQSLGA